MLPVDAVVVAGAEGIACLGFHIRITTLVIAMFGLTSPHRFDNGLLWVIVKTNKPIVGCFDPCVWPSNHGAGIGKGRDYLAIGRFTLIQRFFKSPFFRVDPPPP